MGQMNVSSMQMERPLSQAKYDLLCSLGRRRTSGYQPDIGPKFLYSFQDHRYMTVHVSSHGLSTFVAHLSVLRDLRVQMAHVEFAVGNRW